jgi:hypothetical protein
MRGYSAPTILVDAGFESAGGGGGGATCPGCPCWAVQIVPVRRRNNIFIIVFFIWNIFN